MGRSNTITHSTAASATTVVRGRVAHLTGEELFVRLDGEQRLLPCHVLYTSDKATLALRVGDPVIVASPAGEETFGCVLGRIGLYRKPDTVEVVIEAKESLTLRCGEGSIEMRADGKVLTRANDIAQVAKRLNRIKGGAVEIN